MEHFFGRNSFEKDGLSFRGIPPDQFDIPSGHTQELLEKGHKLLIGAPFDRRCGERNLWVAAMEADELRALRARGDKDLEDETLF